LELGNLSKLERLVELLKILSTGDISLRYDLGTQPTIDYKHYSELLTDLNFLSKQQLVKKTPSCDEYTITAKGLKIARYFRSLQYKSQAYFLDKLVDIEFAV